LENAKLFATTNPDSMMHWLYTEFLENASLWIQGDGSIKEIPGQLDLARFSFRLEDNPYLPVDYIDSIKREYTGLWYKRFIEGLWVLAEGAIYDMFDPDIHVVDEIPGDMDFIAVGVDYGTVNPFDAVALGLSDGKMYVTSEFRYDSKKEKKQKTDSEYLQDIVSWLGGPKIQKDYGSFSNPRFVCIDPSARSFIVESLMAGIFTPTKANNSVIDGIRCVASLLANKQLFIHSSCEHLIKELATYSWDNNAALKGQDVPLKIHDHACDALRYAIYTTRMLWKSQVVDYSFYQTAA
jgi:Phage terminase large subunit